MMISTKNTINRVRIIFSCQSIIRFIIRFTMKKAVFLLVALWYPVSSFLLPSQNSQKDAVSTMKLDTRIFGYIPDGMTPEQWKKLKQKETATKAGKKFGAYGPQSFKSRSMQAFQKDLEKGKTGHLLPVFNAKEQIKAGKLKQEDIPYMQRGGAWDNSDVGKAKRKKWSDVDKNYKANEAPPRPDWLGTVQRSGPQKGRANDKSGNKVEKAKPTKKLFGLF